MPYLTTVQFMQLHQIGCFTNALAPLLAQIDVNALPDENRSGLLNALDALHDQIHLIKQTTNTPNPHASQIQPTQTRSRYRHASRI